MDDTRCFLPSVAVDLGACAGDPGGGRARTGLPNRPSEFSNVVFASCGPRGNLEHDSIQRYFIFDVCECTSEKNLIITLTLAGFFDTSTGFLLTI